MQRNDQQFSFMFFKNNQLLHKINHQIQDILFCKYELEQVFQIWNVKNKSQNEIEQVTHDKKWTELITANFSEINSNVNYKFYYTEVDDCQLKVKMIGDAKIYKIIHKITN